MSSTVHLEVEGLNPHTGRKVFLDLYFNGNPYQIRLSINHFVVHQRKCNHTVSENKNISKHAVNNGKPQGNELFGWQGLPNYNHYATNEANHEQQFHK